MLCHVVAIIKPKFVVTKRTAAVQSSGQWCGMPWHIITPRYRHSILAFNTRPLVVFTAKLENSPLADSIRNDLKTVFTFFTLENKNWIKMMDRVTHVNHLQES